ncbi:(2Fe-2S)-binding protein [Sporosarcina jiandibaonis]|uniref:(2Fe-2S)-binding protein n=1 Tax=Sporosarcina jiandibaonis TaxID=2715535 RepID=UPI001553FC81|nr:(2Fe-2S)-binding protein [Sporosarcina jiandibaonis]
MTNNRITDHPVLGKLENQTPVKFTFDGTTYTGFEGDTIASALLANGIRQLRVHEETGAPRAIYCNIGHCFECRVTVDDTDGVRACMTTIRENMKVDSGKLQAVPFKSKPEEWPRTYAEFEKSSKKDGVPHV